MSKKERGIKRLRRVIFYSPSFHAALISILVMGFWLGGSIAAQAQECVDNGEFALEFDEKDEYAAAKVTDENNPIHLPNGFTIEAWIKPFSFTAGSSTFRAPVVRQRQGTVPVVSDWSCMSRVGRSTKRGKES